MSLPNDEASNRADWANATDESAMQSRATAQSLQSSSTEKPTSVEALGARLSEALSVAQEDSDPVAGLELAIRTVADEIGEASQEDRESEIGSEPIEDFTDAIDALVRISLETDDPVKALEEGTDSLAEALAERKTAAREEILVAHERRADEEAAYRHARFHRVTELMDIGYSLDQAVAITNANETEIGVRAAAVGRSPMEPIYEYAVRNGYRRAQSRPEAHGSLHRPHGSAPAAQDRSREFSTLQMLASMGDEEFDETTKGDRWQRLLQA